MSSRTFLRDDVKAPERRGEIPLKSTKFLPSLSFIHTFWNRELELSHFRAGKIFRKHACNLNMNIRLFKKAEKGTVNK